MCEKGFFRLVEIKLKKKKLNVDIAFLFNTKKISKELTPRYVQLAKAMQKQISHKINLNFL